MYEGLKPCPHRQVDDGGRILCGLIKGGDREVSVNLCRACPVPQINCQHLRATMHKKVSTPITVHYATGRVEVWDDEAPTINFQHAACAEKTMPINSPRDCAGCPLRLAVVIPQGAIQVARQHHQPAVNLASPLPPAPPARSIISEIPSEPVAPGKAGRTPNRSAPARRAAEAAEQIYAPSPSGPRHPGLGSAPAKRSGEAAPQTREQSGSERGENKSKIILLQQWIADQFAKKNPEARLPVGEPDQDGVSEITYSPLAPQYEEKAGLERCVGWTD